MTTDVNWNDVSRNLYGCTPCPQCSGVHRYAIGNPPRAVACDDCGLKEPVAAGAHSEE